MSYWTHWHNIKYEIGKRRECLIMNIAWHLPRELTKWAYIRVGANATTGQYSSTVVPDITMMEALQRWE